MVASATMSVGCQTSQPLLREIHFALSILNRKSFLPANRLGRKNYDERDQTPDPDVRCRAGARDNDTRRGGPPGGEGAAARGEAETGFEIIGL
jgi:hypothetical protein